MGLEKTDTSNNDKRKNEKSSGHHIIPKSRGGKKTLENIVTLTTAKHRDYHTLFENKTPEEIIDYLVTDYWNGQWHHVKQAYDKREYNKSKKTFEYTESPHNQIIKLLENRLKSDGRTIILSKYKNELEPNEPGLFPEHEYNFNEAYEADLILIGPSGDYAYAIEVETKNNKKGKRKTFSQLRHDRNFLKKTFDIEKVFLFYAHEGKDGNCSYEIHRYIPHLNTNKSNAN